MASDEKSSKVIQGSGLLSEEQWRRVALSLNLTPSELQVVKFAFDDLSERGMAYSLDRSPHTVHSHFVHIYLKLGVSSRCELIIRVFAEHIRLSGDRDSPGSRNGLP